MSSSARRERRRLNRQRSRNHIQVEEDTISEISWPSRPSTQETGGVSTSRLSTDSGAESIEDFQRRGSSPLPTTFLDYWDGLRRHTAPPRKPSLSPPNVEFNRPNTVHAWDVYPSKSTMSRYIPLPSIGLRTPDSDDGTKANRRYCFQESTSVEESAPTENESEPASQEDSVDKETSNCLQDENDEQNAVFQKSVTTNVPKLSYTLSSTNIESDADSDFDEDTDSSIVYASDEDEDDGTERRKPKKAIVRSATFTIEDKMRELEQSPKLLLAVRLPDGSRVSGYFTPRDTLRNVCVLAMSNLKDSLKSYELVTTDIPKRIFSDFSLSLEAAGIADKTLLNLQFCEDSDSG